MKNLLLSLKITAFLTWRMFYPILYTLGLLLLISLASSKIKFAIGLLVFSTLIFTFVFYYNFSKNGFRNFILLDLGGWFSEDLCWNEMDQVFKLLHSLGRSPDIQNRDGKTALHLCIEKEKSSLIKTLMEYNANPFIQDKEGRLPIDYATSKEIKNVLSDYMIKKSQEQLDNIADIQEEDTITTL